MQREVAEIAGVQRAQPVLIEGVEPSRPCHWRKPRSGSIEFWGRGRDSSSGRSGPASWRARPALFVEAFGLTISCFEEAELVIGVDDREVEPAALRVRHGGAASWRATEWKVPSQGMPSTEGADQRADRSRISRAALLAKADAEDFGGPREPRAQQMREARGW